MGLQRMAIQGLIKAGLADWGDLYRFGDFVSDFLHIHILHWAHMGVRVNEYGKFKHLIFMRYHDLRLLNKRQVIEQNQG